MDDLAKKAIGDIGVLGKQLGSSIVKTPGDITKTVAVQIGIAPEVQQSTHSDQIGAEQKTSEEALGIKKASDFVRLMYKPSSFDDEASDPNLIAGLVQQGNAKTADEQAKIAQIQAQLKTQQHKEVYYDPTFNRPKPPEERVADKNEREEEEKKIADLEFQNEEKKDQDIAITMAQNKTEQFRGISG